MRIAESYCDSLDEIYSKGVRVNISINQSIGGDDVEDCVVGIDIGGFCSYEVSKDRESALNKAIESSLTSYNRSLCDG